MNKQTTRTAYRIVDEQGTVLEQGLKRAYAEKTASNLDGATVEAYAVTVSAHTRATLKMGGWN